MSTYIGRQLPSQSEPILHTSEAHTIVKRVIQDKVEHDVCCAASTTSHVTLVVDVDYRSSTLFYRDNIIGPASAAGTDCRERIQLGLLPRNHG